MTTTWVDFKELRQQLDFASVLRHYGVELKIRGGDRHQGFCPLPGHVGQRRSPSFCAHLGRKIFHCFGCGRKGNCIDFVAYMEGLDPDDGQALRKAALMAAERFGGNATLTASRCHSTNAEALRPAVSETPKEIDRAQNNAERGATRPAIVNAPLDFELKALDFEHPYLKERGFTPETIAHFRLGYCSRGIMQGRIVIPLHDATGKLVGYAGRLVDDSAISDENPKYRFPGARERAGKVYEFRKSLFLYNAFAAGRCKDMIVVEGFPSVWWLWQHGHANVLALMGSDCSEEQANLIVQSTHTDGRVWIMPDGDEAGERCARSLLAQVSRQRFVHWVNLKAGQQPTDCTAEKINALLHGPAAGKGEDHDAA
jgi:DNA primase